MVTRKQAKPAPSRRARGKGPAIGFWLEYPSLPACEIAALVGYDAVLFDLEHGVFTPELADQHAFACKRLGLTTFSRVASATRVDIQYALDSGVDGVILPQIADLAHARQASALAKYPPLGQRGVGFSRTMDYDAIDPDFFAAENRRCLCYAMIETPGALADVEAIAALDTVDGVFIGPSDLSMTRGRGSFRATAADFADFTVVAQAAAGCRKTWAMPAPSATAFDFARRHGAALVAVCDDLTALRLGFVQGLAMARRQ
jgi:2-dehydro-3-deoxyglucarate aldolase/4-hydroxy-2-oxoheptanedioate aldolase